MKEGKGPFWKRAHVANNLVLIQLELTFANDLLYFLNSNSVKMEVQKGTEGINDDGKNEKSIKIIPMIMSPQLAPKYALLNRRETEERDAEGINYP